MRYIIVNLFNIEREKYWSFPSSYSKDKRKTMTEDFIDSKDSKVDKCVQNVADIYKQTQDTKGVQIIFSDIAVNSDKGSVWTAETT